MGAVRAFCHGVDKVNEWTGKSASMLHIPLVLIVMLEIVLRYFFDSPTIWAWDVNIQLSGTLILLGGGYTLLNKGHVSIDVIVNRFPIRVRTIIELVTSLIFFTGIGALLWLSVGEAQYSVHSQEHWTSVWSPPIYPYRIVIVIGLVLLLLQGIVKFIHDIDVVRGKETGGEA